MVLVTKKNGAVRFCIGYWKLNGATNLDVFLLPWIDDSLDLYAHTKYFTILDLVSGFWQVLMDPQTRERTVFYTPAGLYEFLVMPFGSCIVLATL